MIRLCEEMVPKIKQFFRRPIEGQAPAKLEMTHPPAGFPSPMQHMPPLFTRLLAERLNSTCQLQHKGISGWAIPIETTLEKVADGELIRSSDGLH